MEGRDSIGCIRSFEEEAKLFDVVREAQETVELALKGAVAPGEKRGVAPTEGAEK